MHEGVVDGNGPIVRELVFEANSKVGNARILKGGIGVSDRRATDEGRSEITQSIRSGIQGGRVSVWEPARRRAAELSGAEKGDGLRAAAVGGGREKDRGGLSVIQTPSGANDAGMLA